MTNDLMKRISQLAGIALGLAGFVLSLSAHPGHSLGEHGPLHVVTSPYHLAILALAGAGLMLVARFIRPLVLRRIVQSAGLIAMVAAAVIWGVRG